MIQQLSIKGFKSIRQLDLSCRRVNVFIGEPNTGKTNILEALGLGCLNVRRSMKECLRVTHPADLFWDQNSTNSIEITFDEIGFAVSASANEMTAGPLNGFAEGIHDRWSSSLQHTRHTQKSYTQFYLFEGKSGHDLEVLDRLAPPFGQNIANLLYSNQAARQSSAKFFAGSGFKLTVDYTSRSLKVTKEVDDVLISLPYASTSETLRRMIFYNLVLDTNSDQVLVFDEPEAHAFPPFTKRFAERIASDDKGNQFFLTTHSPYMLDSLLSKTLASDLNVVLCRMENFETKAYPLNETQIGKLMEWSMDAFFNFDRLLDIKE